jgi:hypothetical protein
MCVANSDVRFTPNSDRESGLPQTVMSALPPKADVCSATAHVCFGPIADIGCLFDYLVSGLLQMRRHGEAKRLGGLEVDYEHELGWCLYRKTAWIFAL